MNTEKSKEFEKIFKTNACYTMSDIDMEKILIKEREKYQNSEKLNISPTSYMGTNTARYAKDTLRRHQPLFLLYASINFLTESSILLLLMSVMEYFTGDFFSKVSVFFLPLALSITTIKDISKNYTGYSLSKGNKPSTLVKFILSLLCISIILLLYFVFQPYLHTYMRYITVFNTFLLTVGLITLSLIHNAIYESMILCFFKTGFGYLFKKDKLFTSGKERYVNARKKLFETIRFSESKQETKSVLFKHYYTSHLRTDRIYILLALILSILLLVISIITLISGQRLQPGLCIMGLISAISSFLLFICFLACNIFISDI